MTGLIATDVVRVESCGSMWTVGLSRAERANALDDALVAALLRVVETAAAAGARALVITATGRAFCGGFDMSGLGASSDGDLAIRFLRIGELLEALYAAPFVTMACVAGPAAGAGADLAAACDHRIVEPGASLRFPGAAFGVVLGTRRLAALVGAGVAADLIGSGRRIDADEALRIGLATELAEPGDGERHAAILAGRLERLDRETFTAMLGAMRPGDRGLGLADLASSLARNPDLGGRIAAYREAQKPAAALVK